MQVQVLSVQPSDQPGLTLSILRHSRPGFSAGATGCELLPMFRAFLTLGFRRLAILALLAALSATQGCKIFTRPSPGVGEQAAEFGAYQRPKSNPLLRFGVSSEAQEIEEHLGH